MTRDEVVRMAREILSRDPVDPALWAELLTIIPNEASLAAWLISNSGWLAGARPLDVWRTDRAAVIEAARRTAEPLPF